MVQVVEIIAPMEDKGTCLSCIVNTMAADNLVMQGNRASAATVLILFV